MLLCSLPSKDFANCLSQGMKFKKRQLDRNCQRSLHERESLDWALKEEKDSVEEECVPGRRTCPTKAASGETLGVP